MQQFLLLSKQGRRLFHFLKHFSLFPIPNLKREEKPLTTPHSARRSMEPFHTATFHWLQMQARNSYALQSNIRKRGKKPVKFWTSSRMEIRSPLQATCSGALPYALWKSMSFTVICHTAPSPFTVQLWKVALSSPWKVANHTPPTYSHLLQVLPP